MQLTFAVKTWPLKTAFVTSQDNLSEIDTVHVQVMLGKHTGRGEALGVDYHGETAATMLADLEGVRCLIETCDDAEELRHKLLQHLTPGGARNALDCALWDLQAKQSNRRVWQLLSPSIEPTRSVETAITLNLDAPSAMAQQALSATGFKTLKLKVDSQDPIACIAAVNEARPDCDIIIDANSAWSLDQLSEWSPLMHRLGVCLIEQPLAVDQDDSLVDFVSAVPLCADESIHDATQLEHVSQRYQLINIKLDKTGGLTAAMQLLKAAKKCKLELMVGNMLGSSLAMAPAFIVAQHCRWVDLDGPLLQAEDMPGAIQYNASTMMRPSSELWG